MILVIASGVFMTLLGVALGCMVLELTMRALGHSVTEHNAKPVSAVTVRRVLSKAPLVAAKRN